MAQEAQRKKLGKKEHAEKEGITEQLKTTDQMKWVQKMKNSDGSTGEHWSFDQTYQLMKQRNIDCEPAEFYAAMNMLWSDYGKVAEKFGADLILIETMTDSYETKAAVLAAKENCDLPVFVTCVYDESKKLMTGADPLAMVTMLEGLGVDAIGVNCSLGPKMLAPVVEKYLKYSSIPTILKPNAGLPKVIDGKTVYDIDPSEFAVEVENLVKKGVRICGGCCGTTPEHIAAIFDKKP